MKKKLLLSAVILGALSFSSVVLAAANPFTSVPKDHWAYSAVEKLVQAGLVDGYGDADFRGEKAISRYEMAVLVAKAMSNVNKADDANKVALDRLSKEYSDELNNMGVRLKKVEDKMSSFKWYGDTRLRYYENKDNKMKQTNDGHQSNSSQFEERLRLGFYGEINENLSVTGRMKYENAIRVNDGWGGKNQNFNSWDNSYRDQNSFRLDMISLDWNHADTKVSIGRTEVNLGQGILWWENQVDGIYATHKFGDNVTVSAGWGDLAAEGWQPVNMGAFMANIDVATSDATHITISHLKTNDKLKTSSTEYQYKWEDVGGTWLNIPVLTNVWTDQPYAFDQYAVGFNTQLSDKVNLLGEYVKNNADIKSTTANGVQDHGWWTRLTYGKQDWRTANTWKLYADFLSLGNDAVDSDYWGHRLNVAGGNGFNGAGDKGWGLGLSYMLASCTNLELTYYKLKPYDEGKAGFSKYEDVAYAALTFSF
ncbi:hypothetical protein Ga0466249_004378 [Sporomusaceae bacterium BoRhaA]|uniref:S-layer homology domain-containing protein n=1 Tax=Pelorhabdus rhamnosifermentans TaxID=2772457 RepID=UPI001C06386C|nr:S-layer homology domain-containing protein [Pelorhabdus rhamnosifermentans]MBU2703238.1 hypothetical protein [Pelorhabdus rhamnosifermentans]